MNVPSQPPALPEFVFPEQLSSRIGISVQTLARWRCEGRGPGYVKIGKRVAYPVDAVDKWLGSCTRQSPNDDWK